MANDAMTVRLYTNIRLEFDDSAGVALLTLNRPKALNALNGDLLRELEEALEDVATRPGARVLILTGAGAKAFAAGADIAEMQGFTPAQAEGFAALGQRVFSRLEALPVAVIAAVNGFALGGGCELAMACDIIVASASAVFGQPEVKLGVIPGFGGSQRLTGRSVKADEALRIGLVTELVEGDVVEAAKKLAETIAKNGPRAVALCKRAINDGADLALAPALSHERTLFGLCFATSDQREGMAAFLERRKPDFTGR
jgi:enoyl-CoA hydratase